MEFTVGVEQNEKLSFLDIKICRDGNTLLMVYMLRLMWIIGDYA